MRLRAGVHPVTGDRLPAARGNDGNLLSGSGLYSQLRPNSGSDSSFGPYVPDVLVVPKPQSGASAVRKLWLMQGRIRCKVGSEARRLRKLRRRAAKVEVRGIITSFTNGPDSGVADAVVLGEAYTVADLDGKDSDEEFWSKLDHREWDTPLSMQPVGVHCNEPVQHCRGSKPSRMMRLAACGSKAG